MTKRSHPWPMGIVLAVAAAILWACGGTPLMVEPLDQSLSPAEAAARLAEEIDRAQADQVDVLSPTWFQKAKASLAASRQAMEEGDAPERIRRTIATGNAELQQAKVVTIRSRDQLADAIQSRDAARAVDAQQFREEYAEVENDFLRLTRAMEDSAFDYARERRRKVSDRYRDLELRAISLAAVGDVRHLLQNAIDAKVPQIAPKSFIQAEESLNQAEATIAANRYDQSAILQKADHARFMMQRAMVIAGTSRMIEGMTPEDIALWMESFFFRTTTGLKSADRRDLSFEEQQGAILSQLDSLQAELTLSRKSVAEKSDLIRKLSDRLAEVEGTAQRFKLDKQQLAAEKRFNELFGKVQNFFGPQEAEVYKQSDHLVIRLKGMQFPVGAAAILPENEALLNKVQQAILAFGSPDVVIEGHTDSTGSQEKNQTLSKRRAEAVKHYLGTRYVLPEDKISALGYGSARPLASNETTAGRALNRRIDVIIKPRPEKRP